MLLLFAVAVEDSETGKTCVRKRACPQILPFGGKLFEMDGWIYLDRVQEESCIERVVNARNSIFQLKRNESEDRVKGTRVADPTPTPTPNEGLTPALKKGTSRTRVLFKKSTA